MVDRNAKIMVWFPADALMKNIPLRNKCTHGQNIIRVALGLKGALGSVHYMECYYLGS